MTARRSRDRTQPGSAVEAEQQIVELRCATGWGPKRLAGVLGWPAATIWRVLRRHGISRRAAAPRPPANRYEYAAPGELVHLDIKQLGRFWQVGKRALGEGAGSATARLAGVPAPGSGRSLALRRRAAAPHADQQRRRGLSGARTRALRRARHPGAADHERQRLLLRRQRPPPAVPDTASGTSAPGPTRPAPTEKQKRLSASCCANGPTATPGTQAPTAPARYPATYAGTTPTEPTAPSAAHPSPASHRLSGPTARCVAGRTARSARGSRPCPGRRTRAGPPRRRMPDRSTRRDGRAGGR